MKALWLKRLPLYEQADYIADTDGRNATEVAQAVAQMLKTEDKGC